MTNKKKNKNNFYKEMLNRSKNDRFNPNKEHIPNGFSKINPSIFDPPKSHFGKNVKSKHAKNIMHKTRDSYSLNKSAVGSAMHNNYFISRFLSQGIGFMGYSWLSLMANRAEFNNICHAAASTPIHRKGVWYCIEDNKKSQERVDYITRKFDELNCWEILHKLLFQSMAFGIGHLYVQTDQNDDEIPLPTTGDSFKGKLRGFKTIEAFWITPGDYNADDPRQDNYYKPSQWFVQNFLCHSSRMYQIVPFPVMDLLKPAFNFGGLALTQMVHEYVNSFLRMRESMSDVIANASYLCFGTDLSQLLAPDGDGLLMRIKTLDELKEGQSTVVYNKPEMGEGGEQVDIKSQNLNGFQEILDQYLKLIAVTARMPIVKLTGEGPSGMNASSEGEIRAYYEEVSAFQERKLRPLIKWISDLIQKDKYGNIDSNVHFKFNPLWEMDEKDLSEMTLKNMQSLQISREEGFISSDEGREAIASTPGMSMFDNLDLSGKAPDDGFQENEEKAQESMKQEENHASTEENEEETKI